MAYKVVYSSKAKSDLANILNYICNDIDSPRYATRLLDKIDHTTHLMGDYPELFRIVKLTKDLKDEVRIAPVNGYVILYTVDNFQKVVTIIKIASGKSNYL